MASWIILTREAPFNRITGFTVSIVTNELSLILLFVMMRVLPVEFVTVIENVTFPLASPGKTVVLNSALPPFVVLVNSRPSKVPVKLPRSLLSASRVTVMVLPAFAKLSPEELAILSEFICIGFTAYTVTVLVTESGTLPAASAGAV